MSELKTLEVCLQCGGELQADPRTGVLECIYCHRKHVGGTESFSDDLKRIVEQRQLREFIKAEELCEELIKKQPNSPEAHWQMVLAKLGVVYVNEGGDSKPTFFSCSYSDRESILNDINYKKALDNAKSGADRLYYEDKAKELDELLQEFFMLIKKEKNYDIFISFKHLEEVTDAHGAKRKIETKDCRKAREIYEQLKDKYHVFFSPVSIGQDTGIQGEKYEPRILKAIQSSQAMILVGFTEENIKSQWVENEWRRYKYQIDKGKKLKKSLIYVYDETPVLFRLPAFRDIQMPNVDVDKGKYLEEIEKAVAFVSSSKGLKSALSGKKVNVDFESEENDSMFSNNIRSVISIGGSGGKEQIKISANEERSLQSAESDMARERFGEAINTFKEIIKNNPRSAPAHWGWFKAKIGAKSDQLVPDKLASGKLASSDLNLLDKAIEYSTDADFSWSIIDTIIECFKKQSDWNKVKPLYGFLINYIDENRIKRLLKILEHTCEVAVADGKPKVSEDVFENAKKIFIEEVKRYSMQFMDTYATNLAKYGYYDYARKYFEQLASARNSSYAYIKLLACRIKSSSIAQAVIKLDKPKNEPEEGVVKKVSELTIAEILERIVVCDNKENKSLPVLKYDGTDGYETGSFKTLRECLVYQARYNKGGVHGLVEIVAGTYKELGSKEATRDILFTVAEELVLSRNFTEAEIWYREILADDPNDALAHWGTLKCRLKAVDDYAVSKHGKKLQEILEYNNAKNCADNEQFEYFEKVRYGEIAPPSGGDGSNKKAPARSYEEVKTISVSEILFGTLKLALYAIIAIFSLLTILEPKVIFANIHFGVAIAVFVGLWIVVPIVLSRHKGGSGDDLDSHILNNRKTSEKAMVWAVSLVTTFIFCIGMFTAGHRSYHLTTANDLNLLANLPSANTADYILENDIDFEGNEFGAFGKMGEFEGTFDGQGYVISNFVVNAQIGEVSDSYQGVNKYSFGFITSITSGEIKDVTFDSCVVKIDYQREEQRSYIGFVTGVNGGSIANCHVIDCYIALRPQIGSVENFLVGGISACLGQDVYSTPSVDNATYGKGSITNSSFVCVNDADDFDDDDNYAYAIIISKKIPEHRYTVNGITCTNATDALVGTVSNCQIITLDNGKVFEVNFLGEKED
ncbi:MAG: toll/interleukin-1 receptor domain-containing protein [Clostridia bacterium]|nr:toll/interleukin-1 receptor domain-containing protein [Clostridia bacterium]